MRYFQFIFFLYQTEAKVFPDNAVKNLSQVSLATVLTRKTDRRLKLVHLGVYREASVAKAFDRLGFQQHLGSGGEMVKAQPKTPPSTSTAGLPIPTFVDAKSEDLSGTIPWQNTDSGRDEGKEKQATASNSNSGVTGNSHTIVEIAHHHHLHLQPSPTAHIHFPTPACLSSPARMIYTDDCAQVYPDESCYGSRPPASVYRPEICPEARQDGPAAVTSSTCTHHSAEDEEEERFNLNLRRMVTRAEQKRQERLMTKRNHHH